HKVASLSQQFFSILTHKGFHKNETLEILKLSIANPNLYSKYLKINSFK
ncbi:MAG TPA: [acyl-carrier-protein] S-malonyltransferase, partial [Bacillus sp. (in: Bacteria)]|nr:[acyl-carrier-protein] S-malonyltransferase [Bacillus sp. (in: firmicutes)]